ncbi:MAG: M81 family metallopeptidase [Halobacteriales archaeon]|nr:M81 family metallopeptidase [Halobacteriales archaeon]
MASERILVGGISHETNTFIQEPTTREDFQRRHEAFDEAVLDELRGTNTVIGGVIEAAAEEMVELRPTMYAAAMPGGIVTEDTFTYYFSALRERVERLESDTDGVLLPLHGAMVPEGSVDGEGAIITMVREIVGPDVPIVVTLDLHGNISETMVETADALVAYETYPHVDTADTGRRGLAILLEILRGELDPTTHIEWPPVILYGPAQNTRGDGPMTELMDRARELETRDGVRKVNVFAGFHQADVPFMGPSTPVVGSDPAAVREAARELARTMWERRDALTGDDPGPTEAIEIARERIDAGVTTDGPIVLADLGDNPGAGSTADTTHVLRALLNGGVSNAGFALIRDTDAVATCHEAGVGDRVAVSIGGKADESSGDPIEANAYVKMLTDGEFVATGPMGTGTTARLGRTALVELGPERTVSVILTEERVQPLDTEIWRHVGIQPERLDAIVVKSTNHFRAAYEPIASDVITINSPGLAAEDPRFYDYDTVTRDLFPMVSAAEISYPDWE